MSPYYEPNSKKPTYEELEACLERVKQLPQKWRETVIGQLGFDPTYSQEMIICADELEFAVKGESP